MYHPDSVYLYNREAAAVAAQRAALERAGHLGSVPGRETPQSISGAHQAIASRMQGFHPSEMHMSYPYPPGSDYTQWPGHAAFYPSAPPPYYYHGYEHLSERLRERADHPEGKRVAPEGSREDKERTQGREETAHDEPRTVSGDPGKSSPLPPASAKLASATQLKARRDRDNGKSKQELPVVSPYQRNAVFGKNGSLVTGRSKKDKHSKHPSAKTGSGESGKSSLTTDAVEQGAQKKKKMPLRVLPKIRPSTTKSVLGVSNFSHVRSILLQQQDSYAQQVADFQRIIARQHFATSRRPKPRAPERPEGADHSAEPLRAGKRTGKTSAFREAAKKHTTDKSVALHPKKSLSSRVNRESKPELPAPVREPAKSAEEGDKKRSADKRKRTYHDGEGSPREDPEAKRGKEAYDSDVAPSAAAASYDAAMAAYTYHQHMMHQMAAAGMPPPGMPSPASYPPSMDPYAMQYMAAMQNPSWYYGYGAPPSSSRGYGKH